MFSCCIDSQMLEEKRSKRKRRMTPDKSTIIRFLIYPFIMVGFSYQSFMICLEYFKYTTITSVTVVPALPDTNFPQVAFCTEWITKEISELMLFELHLKNQPPNKSYLWGNPRLVNVSISGKKKKPDHIVLKKFLQRKRSCFSLATRKPTKLTPEELFLNPTDSTIDVGIQISTPITGISKTYRNITVNQHVKNDPNITIYYDIYMTSYDSDFDASGLVPLVGRVILAYTIFDVALTYSPKVTILYPPPYDTNCRNYRKDGLASQSSCTKKCINEWTVGRYELIFEDHVVERDKFLKNNSTNGSIEFIPYNYKTPGFTTVKELKKMAKDFYKKYEANKNNDSELAYEYKDDSVYYESLAKVYPGLRRRIGRCQMSCSQPDCYTEYITPSFIWMDNADFETDPEGYEIDLHLHPPKEPTVVVTSKEKLILLDFVVYILSCLSFWFGFCPLSFANSLSSSRRDDRVHPIGMKMTDNRDNRDNSRRTRTWNKGNRCFSAVNMSWLSLSNIHSNR